MEGLDFSSQSMGRTLDRIAERLWSNRAVVMVGSGFSKNANTQFPDWIQIAGRLYKETHGNWPAEESGNYLSALRIAQEFEVASGRPALNQFLKEQIRDLSSDPSILHRKLLELPWVDVLTTNYDTLLERAADAVISRKYEVVVNKHDLTYASKPRIIKLHGSLPSHTPFVITEEDYRRYPIENAAFVNTVQQALIENSLCLIGFSGDDPNFLEWIGWIRDNLGHDNIQPMYMVGVFGFSPAKLALLENRGIKVVDFKRSLSSPSTSHYDALHTFITELLTRRKKTLEWSPRIGSSFSEKLKNFWANYETHFEHVAKDWKEERKNYPGWMILPAPKRHRLWEATQRWLPNVKVVQSAGLAEQLTFAYELSWRVDKCLAPLPDSTLRFFEELVEGSWPFLGASMLSTEAVSLLNEKQGDATTAYLQESWIGVAFSLIRTYRQTQKYLKFKNLTEVLKQLDYFLTHEQRDVLVYETYLSLMATFRFDEALGILNNWTPERPFWESLRHLAKAALGDTFNLKQNIELSLERARKLPEDISTLSEEAAIEIHLGMASWITEFSKEEDQKEKQDLIRTAFFRHWFSANDKPGSFVTLECLEFGDDGFDDAWNDLLSKKDDECAKLWSELKNDVLEDVKTWAHHVSTARSDLFRKWKIDLSLELQLLETALRSSARETILKSDGRGFELYTIDLQSSVTGVSESDLDGYRYLRLSELLGISHQISNFSFSSDATFEAVSRVSTYMRRYAFSVVSRLRHAQKLERILTREFLEELTSEEVDEIAAYSLNAWQHLSGLKGHSLAETTFIRRARSFIFGVISRISVAISKSLRSQLFHFLIDELAVYELPNIFTYAKVAPQLFKTMSNSELVSAAITALRVCNYKQLPALKHLKNEVLARQHQISKQVQPEQTKELQELLREQQLLLEIQQDSDALTAIWCKLIVAITMGITPVNRQASLLENLRQQENNFPTPLLALQELELSDVLGKQSESKYLENAKNYLKQGLSENYLNSNAKSNSASDVISIFTIAKFLASDSFMYALDDREVSTGITESMNLIVDSTTSLSEYEYESDWHDHKKKLWQVAVISLQEDIMVRLFDGSEKSLAQFYISLAKALNKTGLPNLRIKAKLASIVEEHKSSLKSEIAYALGAEGYEVHADAVEAIGVVLMSKNDEFVDMLEGHVTLLCEFLNWGCDAKVINILEIISLVILKSPEVFTQPLRSAVVARLVKLEQSTHYSDDTTKISFNEKVHIRHQVAILTERMWGFYTARDLQLPDILIRWRQEFLKNEPFRDVRLPWLNSLVQLS